MSAHTCLVSVYDGEIHKRGDVIDWTDGLNWKLMPHDPDERSRWDQEHRNDERVAERVEREWKGRSGGPGSDGLDDGLPGYPKTWKAGFDPAMIRRLG